MVCERASNWLKNYRESLGSRLQAETFPVEEIEERPYLKQVLRDVDEAAYGLPKEDPFYSGASSHLTVVREKEAPVGFAAYMTREVGTEDNEGGFVSRVRQVMEDFDQPRLPDGEKVVFVNNVVSLASGGGRKIFKELKRTAEDPIMIVLLTRSARLATAMEKGLGVKYEAHYGGYNPSLNDPWQVRRDFIEACFHMLSGFNSKLIIVQDGYAFNPARLLPSRGEAINDAMPWICHNYFFKIDGIRGEIIYPDDKHTNFCLDKLLSKIEEWKSYGYEVTLPVIAFNKDFLFQMKGFRHIPYIQLEDRLPAFRCVSITGTSEGD